MAYYANGILISGANTLPKMTMAEYLALPVSERPTYWECTDKDYDEISAENVSYGSGTVKDALDGLTANNGANGVDITSYSSSSNKYTFPSDGYLIEAIGAQTSGKCIVLIYGANGASLANLCLNAAFNYQCTSVFVRKGMSCYIYSRDSNVSVEFRGLT